MLTPKIWGPNLLINMASEVLSLQCVRASVGSLLTTESDTFPSKFLQTLVYLLYLRLADVNLNGHCKITKSRHTSSV